MAADVYSNVDKSGMTISRNGDLAIVAIAAQAVAVTASELRAVQKWARTRISSGNITKDRCTFLDRFALRLPRIGSGLSTKGGKKSMRALVRLMEVGGMSLHEWQLPEQLWETMTFATKPTAAELAAAEAEALADTRTEAEIRADDEAKKKTARARARKLLEQLRSKGVKVVEAQVPDSLYDSVIYTEKPSATDWAAAEAEVKAELEYGQS